MEWVGLILGVAIVVGTFASVLDALVSGPRTHVPGQPMPVRRPVDRRPETPEGRPTT